MTTWLSPRSKQLSEDRIFDYFLRIELKPDNNSPCKLSPELVMVYPQAASSQKFIERVTQFCFPDALSDTLIKKAEVYSFVVTDTAGVQRWGYCTRRLLGGNHHPPTCFCILSAYPCFSIFDMVLQEVLVRASSPRAVSDFLFEVLVGPLPAPGDTIHVTTVSWKEAGVIDNLVFVRPTDDAALFDYVNFAPLLLLCDAEVILTLFSSLLVERRVVFSSDSLESLTACVNALLALLRPLQWQYIFIPLLPVTMVSFCSSPIPFVVGMLNTALEKLRNEPHDEIVLLDIDNNEFLTDTPDRDIIPPSERDLLLTALRDARAKLRKTKTLTQQQARALSETFVAFFGSVLHNWRKFYADNAFQLSAFVKTRPDGHYPLLNGLCSSQMFTQYAARVASGEGADELHDITGGLALHDDVLLEAPDAAAVAAAAAAAASTRSTGDADASEPKAKLGRLKRLVRRKTDQHHEHAPDEVVFKQGWLTKLSGRKKSKSDRRWFKLTATRLQYFKNRSDSKEAGHVKLEDVTYITDNCPEQGREGCMELVTKERRLVLYADSLAELADWYPHVQMLCVNSTTHQQPDDRSALALASTLALVPEDVQQRLPRRDSREPSEKKKSATSSMIANLLRRTSSTRPSAPPNPYARRDTDPPEPTPSATPTDSPPPDLVEQQQAARSHPPNRPPAQPPAHAQPPSLPPLQLGERHANGRDQGDTDASSSSDDDDDDDDDDGKVDDDDDDDDDEDTEEIDVVLPALPSSAPPAGLPPPRPSSRPPARSEMRSLSNER